MKSQLLILVLVLAANVGSALGVVYALHQSRALAVELAALEVQMDEGLAEWSALQIEQATWADGSKVEETARRVLHMQQPNETKILVVRP